MDLIIVLVILGSLLGTVRANGTSLDDLQEKLQVEEKLTLKLQAKNAELKLKAAESLRKNLLIASLQDTAKGLKNACSNRSKTATVKGIKKSTAPVVKIKKRSTDSKRSVKSSKRKGKSLFRSLLRRNPNLKLKSVQKELLSCLTKDPKV